MAKAARVTSPFTGIEAKILKFQFKGHGYLVLSEQSDEVPKANEVRVERVVMKIIDNRSSSREV